MLKQQAKRGEGGSLCKIASSHLCKIQSGFIQGGKQERAAGCSLGNPVLLFLETFTLTMRHLAGFYTWVWPLHFPDQQVIVLGVSGHIFLENKELRQKLRKTDTPNQPSNPRAV